MIGVVPRILLLSVFGMALVKYTKPSLLIMAGIIVIFAAVKIAHKFYESGLKDKAGKKG